MEKNNFTDRTVEQTSDNFVSTSSPERVVNTHEKSLYSERVTDTQENSNNNDRNTYEVVFFIKYHIPNIPRPSKEDAETFFNNYGVVHHINYPQNRNFMFVFMTSLNTPVEHRRTRTTISQIIRDMTPENKFHITVANSNRGGYRNNYRRQNMYNMDYRPRVDTRQLNQYDPNDQVQRQNRRPFTEQENNQNRRFYKRPFIEQENNQTKKYYKTDVMPGVNDRNSRRIDTFRDRRTQRSQLEQGNNQTRRLLKRPFTEQDTFQRRNPNTYEK